jgi:hypothetical protein
MYFSELNFLVQYSSIIPSMLGLLIIRSNYGVCTLFYLLTFPVFSIIETYDSHEFQGEYEKKGERGLRNRNERKRGLKENVSF